MGLLRNFIIGEMSKAQKIPEKDIISALSYCDNHYLDTPRIYLEEALKNYKDSYNCKKRSIAIKQIYFCYLAIHGQDKE